MSESDIQFHVREVRLWEFNLLIQNMNFNREGKKKNLFSTKNKYGEFLTMEINKMYSRTKKANILSNFLEGTLFQKELSFSLHEF